MKRKITTGIIAIICLIILIIGIISYNLFLSNINIAETEYIYIDKDDNADSVITKIKNTGAEFSEEGFKFLSSRNKQSNTIRPGRYRVSSDINTLELFRNIRNHNSEPIQLVVPSVRTIQIMASRLSNELMVDSAEIISLLESDEYLKSIGYTHTSIPSLFIPNTYEVYWEISAEDLIARMVKEHNAFWNDNRKALAKKIGLTELEVSTLASIVDSETANNGEKNRIAGLYMNRLHKNIFKLSRHTTHTRFMDCHQAQSESHLLQVLMLFSTMSITTICICVPKKISQELTTMQLVWLNIMLTHADMYKH